MAKNYTPIDVLIKKYRQAKTVGSPVKESLIVQPKENNHLWEAVEHEPTDEVKPFVDVRPTSIKLPPDLKMIGLAPVTATQFPSYKNIKLPIGDDEIISGLHAPLTSSLRWLSALAIYILAKAHLSLRSIHGKVVRVVKR